MKSQEYLNECLIKRLLSFIDKYHKREDIVFWPDVETIYYQKDVQKWYNDNGIGYVAKKDNPPNVPQARPIELFYKLCKELYLKHGIQPRSLVGYRKIWTNVSKTVCESHALAY